ncbi:MAG: LEA type 2 family protein [Bacteroidales bacterium]|jgi:LEA14-like dessication related protein|nr:LEA type 2 family protein [Bacteroidales bacterium]
MRKIVRVIVLVMLTASFTACEQLAQIANQAAQVMNLKNCTFDVTGVNNINMLGIDLSKGMDQSNLNAAQLIKVTNSLMNKKLPVTFNVNLDVNNPNSIAAALGKMDYIIALNNKEVISSTFTNGFSIAPNSKGQVAIPISTDLFQLFSGETADAILNLAFKLAGAKSDPVNLGVKVKPYIKINNQSLAYPDYITINKVLE